MKAIILAAGQGRRLHSFTKGQPKSLLEVGGLSLLEHDLYSLSRAGFAEAVLVTGYESDAILDRVGEECFGMRISFVVNDRFDTMGNLHSLRLARAHFGSSFLAMDADLLFPHAMVADLLESPLSTALLVAPLDGESGEEVVVYGEAPFEPTRIGKGLVMLPGEITLGESVGMVRYGSESVEPALECMEDLIRRNPMAEQEDLMQALVDRGLMKAVESRRPWLEVDFPEDVERARSVVYPEILRQEKEIRVRKSFTD